MPSKGEIHDAFVARVDELADQAGRKADAARGQGQRPWNRPEGWSGDPLDVPGLTAAYDRSAIAANYAALLAAGDDPGTAGDAVSLKLQSDCLAIQERALRARYASGVRCSGHAAARWRGHAHPAGALAGVVRYAQDAIVAGGG